LQLQITFCILQLLAALGEYERQNNMHISPDMEFAAIIIALIAFAAYREYLRLQRRSFIHRERLAAIEKGMDLPPLLEEEQKRSSWNVQRTLLLAGLIWISLGITGFITVSAILASEDASKLDVVQGVKWVALGPVSIGISHLVVYLAGRNKNQQ
jgi:hypothetical protein